MFPKALALDRSNAPAYAGLGEAYSFQHASNPDDQFLKLARANATRAIELNPLLADAHVSLGAVEIEAGKYADAEREFRRALELQPSSSDALLNLGDALTRQNRTQEAEEAYRQLLQLHPDDWRAYLFLGALLEKAGRYDSALTALQKAGGLVQDNVVVYRLLGVAYQKLGRDNDAAEALQKALAVRPTASVYSALGALYFYTGRYQDAVVAFQGAVAIAANDYHHWDNLGDAYRYTPTNRDKANQAYAEAIRLVRQRLEKTPGNLELRTRLALFLAKSGQTEAAKAELRRIPASATLDPASLFFIGTAQELLNDRQAALNSLARSVRAGYSVTEIEGSPDLIALRRDPGYHLAVLAQPKDAGK